MLTSRATVSGGKSIFTADGSGDVRTVVNPTGNDPSSPFGFLFTPDLNDAGQVGVKVQRGSSTSADEVRVFNPDGTSTLVAAEAGGSPGSAFSSIDNSVTLNDAGEVAFAANLVAGGRGVLLGNSGGVTSTFTSATSGSVSVFTPDVNDEGLVVFRGRDSANNNVDSILVGDDSGMLTSVAFVGQTVTLDSGLTDTIMSFAQNPRINDAGDVMFVANAVPEPSASLAPIGGAGLLALRWRRS